MFCHARDGSLCHPRQAWKGGCLLLLSIIAVCAGRQLSKAEGDQSQTRDKSSTMTAQDGRSVELDPLLAEPRRDHPIVSLVRLIANPERYHNQHIRVEGYLVVEFEGTGIYLSKQDADHGMMANAFRVAFDRAKIPFDSYHGPVRFANHYVTLEGTFNMENPGHWQGAITNVDRVSLLSNCGERRERDARKVLDSAKSPAVRQRAEGRE